MSKNARPHETEPEERDRTASSPSTSRSSARLRAVRPETAPKPDIGAFIAEHEEEMSEAENRRKQREAEERHEALVAKRFHPDAPAPALRPIRLAAAERHLRDRRESEPLPGTASPERIPSGTVDERLRFAAAAETRLAELTKACARLEKPYDAAWPIILELRNYEVQLTEMLDDARVDEDMLAGEGRPTSLDALAKAQHGVHRLLEELEQVTRLRQTAFANAEQREAREQMVQRNAQEITRLMAIRAELPALIKNEPQRNRVIADLRGRAERLHDEIAGIERLPAAERGAPEHAAVHEMAKYLRADALALIETLEHAEELTEDDFIKDEQTIDLTDEAVFEEAVPAKKTEARAPAAPFVPLPRPLTPEQRALRAQTEALKARVASGTTEDVLSAAMDMLPESIRNQTHAPPETPADTNLVDAGGERETSGIRESALAREAAGRETPSVDSSEGALRQEWTERQNAKQKRFAERDAVPVSLAETAAKATRAQHLIRGVQHDLHIPMTYETRERCDDALLALSKLYALLKERQTLLMEQAEPSDERERADARKEKDLIAGTLFEIEDTRHAIHLASNSALTEQRTIPERKQAVRDFEEVKKTRIRHVIEEIKGALARAGETDPEAALRRDSKPVGKKPKYEIPNATHWALQNELHAIEREFLNRLYGAPGLEELAAKKRVNAPLLRLNANASIFDLWRAANAELERTSPELGKEKTPRKDPWLTRVMDRVQNGAARLVMGKPRAGAQPDHWLTRTMDAMFDRRPRRKKASKAEAPSAPSREVTRVKNRKVPIEVPDAGQIERHVVAEADAAGIADAQRLYETLLRETSGKEIAQEVPRYLAAMARLSRSLTSGKQESIQHDVRNFEKLHERFAAERVASAEGAALLANAKKTLNDLVAPAYLREDARREKTSLQATLVAHAESAGVKNAQDIYDQLLRDTAATKHAELTSEVPTYLAAMTRLALALRKQQERQELERALTAFTALNARFKLAGFPVPEGEKLLKEAKKAVMEPIASPPPSRAA